MDIETHIENLAAIGTGIILGITKPLSMLPNASESINTLVLAVIGGIGAYAGKELIRYTALKIRKKLSKKDDKKKT